MVEEKTIIEPLVSIIIATLNSERFLRDALTSVESQGYSNFEILMIDGGSTDNTKKIGSSFKKVKIIEQSGKGLFVAWNEGLIAAKGDFIAFLDSDDFWGKDALGEHMKALLGEPNSLGSLGRLKFFVEDGQKPPAEFKLSLLNGDHLAYMPGCFVGRKEIFELIGLFETQWEIASDIVWFSKIKELEEGIVFVNDIVLNKRVHNKNISYAAAETNTYSKELLQLLHNKLKNRNS